MVRIFLFSPHSAPASAQHALAEPRLPLFIPRQHSFDGHEAARSENAAFSTGTTASSHWRMSWRSVAEPSLIQSGRRAESIRRAEGVGRGRPAAAAGRAADALLLRLGGAWHAATRTWLARGRRWAGGRQREARRAARRVYEWNDGSCWLASVPVLHSLRGGDRAGRGAACALIDGSATHRPVEGRLSSVAAGRPGGGRGWVCGVESAPLLVGPSAPADWQMRAGGRRRKKTSSWWVARRLAAAAASRQRTSPLSFVAGRRAPLFLETKRGVTRSSRQWRPRRPPRAAAAAA